MFPRIESVLRLRDSFVSYFGRKLGSSRPNVTYLGAPRGRAIIRGVKIPLSTFRNPPVRLYISPLVTPQPDLPFLVWDKEVCVLVSQSDRPNEMHNRIVATRRFEKWETFSSPCPPRYKPFQKETHSNRSAFPDSNNVCLRFPPFSFTPLPFHPRPTIVLYRVFHENAFSRLPSFIFPFPFLFLPDSP